MFESHVERSLASRVARAEVVFRECRITFLETNSGLLLFRPDGVIIATSPIARSLLVDWVSIAVDERLQRAGALFGTDTVRECVRELDELVVSGILECDEVDCAPADPQSVQPAGILLMVTQTCNLACRYCYADGGTYGSRLGLMSDSVATAAINLMLRRAPERHRFSVTFFGGEPLLNFPLISRVVGYCESIAAKQGVFFSYSMTTNDTLINNEILDFLKEKGFTLMVSLDGPSEFHDELRPYRNGSGSYAEVSRSIKKLGERGIPFQLRVTLMPASVDEGAIQAILDTARGLGCQRVVMTPVDCSYQNHRPTQELLCFSGQQLARLGEIYKQITTENMEGAGGKSIFDPHASLMRALSSGRARKLTLCGACYGMSAVATDGCIFPCHRFVGMSPYAIGSVEKGVDFDRVKGFFSAISESERDQCGQCWASSICGGQCYFHRATGSGSFAAPDEEGCESFRRSLRNSAELLVKLRALSHHQAEQYVQSVAHL